MDWYKHFSDMHEGRSVNNLLDQMGHTGLCFFLIQEMCAKKFTKNKFEVANEDDCLFRFHQRIVRQKLRISATNLRRLLDICAANGLLSWSLAGNTIEISMPILLDLREKDTRNAQKRRLHAASKCAPEKELELEKEYIQEPARKPAPVLVTEDHMFSLRRLEKYEELKARYKASFPGTATDDEVSRKRFVSQMRTDKDLADIATALTNYEIFLGRKENNWRSAKTSFETFLGTKKSGFFWRKYLELPADSVAAQDLNMGNVTYV